MKGMRFVVLLMFIFLFENSYALSLQECKPLPENYYAVYAASCNEYGSPIGFTYSKFINGVVVSQKMHQQGFYFKKQGNRLSIGNRYGDRIFDVDLISGLIYVLGDVKEINEANLFLNDLVLLYDDTEGLKEDFAYFKKEASNIISFIQNIGNSGYSMETIIHRIVSIESAIAAVKSSHQKEISELRNTFEIEMNNVENDFQQKNERLKTSFLRSLGFVIVLSILFGLAFAYLFLFVDIFLKKLKMKHLNDLLKLEKEKTRTIQGINIEKDMQKHTQEEHE